MRRIHYRTHDDDGFVVRGTLEGDHLVTEPLMTEATIDRFVDLCRREYRHITVTALKTGHLTDLAACAHGPDE